MFGYILEKKNSVLMNERSETLPGAPERACGGDKHQGWGAEWPQGLHLHGWAVGRQSHTVCG